MLTKEMIEENKNRFIGLLKDSLVDRPGAQTEALVAKLCNSDFFIAPASTKYHANYEGGLCEHSLNVYDNLMNLIKIKNFEDKINNLSATVVALLHDISKMNYYEQYFQNKKVYSPNGSKYDEGGKYDWKSISAYKRREPDNVFIYGSHEMNAEYITHCYIPLTIDESIAILHHMGGKSADSAQDDISTVYKKYPLAMLLHIADMISTFIDE